MVDPNSKNDEYRCPKCGRPLYDRRRKTCAWCECELPTELLFTKEEIEKLDREAAVREEEREQLETKEKKKEEERKRRITDS